MEIASSNRAGKGGEVGMNGEFYAGGTFLPNTTLAKMAKGRKGTGKQEIAPFKWEVAPDGMRSLYTLFSAFVNIHTGEVVEQACRYYQRDAKVIAAQFSAWKNGILWIAVA